jgi:hypothetical protein
LCSAGGEAHERELAVLTDVRKEGLAMTTDRRTTAAQLRTRLRWLTARVVTVSVLVLGAIGASMPVFAQTTPATAGPVSLGQLFEADTGPDMVKLKPGADTTFKDAVRNAVAAWDDLSPGQCPRPRITLSVPKDDDLFQQALAAARRDVLIALLAPRDANKFAFLLNVEGPASNVEIDASVADTAAPTITVDPPSGTRVKNGQRLTIKVTATEPPTGWQAGVRQIQIEDLDRHTNLEPWNNPVPSPRPCGNAGLEWTIERRYEVPADVPVARLKIKARDYHNPQQELLVEYPTGDWTGTFMWDSTSTHRVTARADIVLNHDGRGNLTGTMAGVHELHAPTSAGCPVTPNRFRISLVGSYTEARSFKVLIRNIEETKITNVCAPGQAGLGFKNIWYPEAFLGTPSPLGDGEILTDGARQYRYGPVGPARETATVTLRPTLN